MLMHSLIILKRAIHKELKKDYYFQLKTEKLAVYIREGKTKRFVFGIKINKDAQINILSCTDNNYTFQLDDPECFNKIIDLIKQGPGISQKIKSWSCVEYLIDDTGLSWKGFSQELQRAKKLRDFKAKKYGTRPSES